MKNEILKKKKNWDAKVDFLHNFSSPPYYTSGIV